MGGLEQNLRPHSLLPKKTDVMGRHIGECPNIPTRLLSPCPDPGIGQGITSVMTSFYSLSGVVGAKIATPLITILKKPMWWLAPAAIHPEGGNS